MITHKNEDQIVVRLKCNENAMRYWALQYGPYVEVLEPESLRKQIVEDIAAMSEKYLIYADRDQTQRSQR
ncbi:MAG: WYL domain-containing protein [Lachnospiraceae bacterium]|nr:WYL domain-containing protein [Lachnospiraceae bacterium]